MTSINKTKRSLCVPILCALFITAFFYRVYGLFNNYAFWSDEAHLALFVRAIIDNGKPVLENGYSTGSYQWLEYWIRAGSVKLLGFNELGIRFPSVLFGSLAIIFTYILAKEVFNRETGLIAAFWTTFLKIEILWSRQARPYQTLQFLFLLSVWSLIRLYKNSNHSWLFLSIFITSGILASLCHALGLIIFIVGVPFLLIIKYSTYKRFIVPILGVFLLLSFPFVDELIILINHIGTSNNFKYFQVFFTHNYPLILISAFMGGAYSIYKKINEAVLLLLFIIVLAITSVLLMSHYTRYIYPVFAFIIIFFSFGLYEFSNFVQNQIRIKNIKLISLIFIFLFICISMRGKISFLPPASLTLNNDMQELPETDWKEVYGLVARKQAIYSNLIVLTNWNDLPVWYLGVGYPSYLVRVRGILDTSVQDPLSGARFVSDIAAFQELLKANPHGIVVLDSWDDRVPDGVREYARDNLKEELTVDRLYPEQPRYWPVTVYSWGLEED